MAISQREKLLVVAAVGLGGIFALYNYVHEPLFARRAMALETSEQVKAELSRDQMKLAREGDLNSRREAVTAREQVIDAWVPGKNSAAIFIWYLSQAEARSGARIKGIEVAEKRLVTATDQQGAVANGQQPAADGQQPAQPEVAPTLAVITLDLDVDARFAEHLLFNQAIEEMPLFLNTDGLSLERAGDQPFERAGQLVERGNTWLANQVLSASPALDGKYQINLYFKAGKPGPSTEVMQFAEATGRRDPFVMTGVDEFIRLLQEHYSYQKELDENAAPGEGRNSQEGPGGRGGQLG